MTYSTHSASHAATSPRPSFQYVEGSNGRDGTYTILDVAGYSHGDAWHELTTTHSMSGRCADLLMASARRAVTSR